MLGLAERGKHKLIEMLLAPARALVDRVYAGARPVSPTVSRT